jgi:glucokinase
MLVGFCRFCAIMGLGFVRLLGENYGWEKVTAEGGHADSGYYRDPCGEE